MSQNLIPNTNASIEEKRQGVYRKIVKWLWILVGAGFLGGILFFFLLSFQDLPTFEDLENPKNNLATEVYAADGGLLGRYYFENRIPVTYDELSPNLVNALVATEDERYYKHSGIDVWALARVLFRTVLGRDASGGGGSTISQQLAKLLYSDRNFGGMSKIEMVFSLLNRKCKEWITAVKLERSYTKNEIIAMYLNKFDFINGAYGIKAASENYFNKSQDSLSVQEAAMLVGMLKNPSLYNPIRREELVLKRREVVLDQMRKKDMLSRQEYDSIRTLDLGLRFNRKTHIDGPAPYFRQVLGQRLKKILDDRNIQKTDGSGYNIFSDGLKIYTTIDTAVQRLMEEAMVAHMSKLQKKFFKRWKGKDPWTYKTWETTKQEIAIRQRSLTKLIRSSDRYVKLREKHLGELLETVKKNFDHTLKDYEIDRMLREEEKEKSYFSKLVSNKIIDKQRAAKYRSIMSSAQWPALKENWKVLQENTEEVFNTPVKMKIFTYENASFEKDSLMSPLDSIRYHRMHLQIGSMAVEPGRYSVKVRGWLGGINYKYFQYDHVTSERQVGSTFKPFVYATAIDLQGHSPCMPVSDVPHTIHVGEGNFQVLEDWTPQNATGKYSGTTYNLKEALKKSVNTVSVYLMKQLGGVEPVRDIVKGMGFDVDARGLNGEPKIPNVPSICLGAADLSVQEMTGAYTVFANEGKYIEPIFVEKIEDENGNVIYRADPVQMDALKPSSNYVLVEMLRYVVQGTRGMAGIESDVGGKTGTTNDYVDGWFMGVTPSLVVGTWVGGEDRWMRFFNLADGQGSTMAKPFFTDLIKRIEDNPGIEFYDKTKRFKRPKGDLGIELDCEMYSRLRNDDTNNDENFNNDIFGDEMDDFQLEDELNEYLNDE